MREEGERGRRGREREREEGMPREIYMAREGAWLTDSHIPLARTWSLAMANQKGDWEV